MGYRHGATSREDMKHNLMMQVRGEVLEPWQKEQLEKELANLDNPEEKENYNNFYRARAGAKRSYTILEQVNESDYKDIERENTRIRRKAWADFKGFEP